MYSGDDLIEGVDNDITFSMSELHTAYESGQGKNRTVTRIFDGLFFVCDFKKKLKTETIVFSDTAEKLFGKLLGQKLQSLMTTGKKELVKLENPKFEKAFAVYSYDQIEARTILTPKIMEFMVKLQYKFRYNPLNFSFIDNKMYLAIHFNNVAKLFEPHLIPWGIDLFREMKKHYDLIHIPLLIAKKMNENSNLWLSK